MTICMKSIQEQQCNGADMNGIITKKQNSSFTSKCGLEVMSYVFCKVIYFNTETTMLCGGTKLCGTG